MFLSQVEKQRNSDLVLECVSVAHLHDVSANDINKRNANCKAVNAHSDTHLETLILQMAMILLISASVLFSYEDRRRNWFKIVFFYILMLRDEIL